MTRMNSKLELVVTEILIGEYITIYFIDNEEMKFSGTVINETKNTIHLKDKNNGKIRIIPKERIQIEKYYKNRKLKIKGSLFKGRSEERIKQEPKKLW
ncbi:MAG: ribonuclease P protein subunit [Candidatus Heimdallarchaeota archaeon]